MSEQPSTPDIKGKGPAAKAAKREQEAQHAAPIQDKLPNSVEAEERKTVHINRAPVLTLWVRAEPAMQSTPACLAKTLGQCFSSASFMLLTGGRAWCTCSPSPAWQEVMATSAAGGQACWHHTGFGTNVVPRLSSLMAHVIQVTKVAEREGFSRDAGLTFGKSISGMLAQSKGR